MRKAAPVPIHLLGGSEEGEFRQYRLRIHHQFPSTVSASPKVQGPQSPVQGTIGVAPQPEHFLLQSGSVSFDGFSVSGLLIHRLLQSQTCRDFPLSYSVLRFENAFAYATETPTIAWLDVSIFWREGMAVAAMSFSCVVSRW